jgi:WD40 repeat protein
VIWIAFSPDGRRLLIATQSIDEKKAITQVRDASTGEVVSPPVESVMELSKASFSPDGRRFVIAPMTAGPASIWDAESGEHVLTLPASANWHASYSPDGSHVLTVSISGKARLWDAQSGEPVGAELERTSAHELIWHHRPFVPEGRLLVLGNLLGASRVWDARASEPVTTSLEHASLAWFGPRGGRIVTGTPYVTRGGIGPKHQRIDLED